MNNRMSARTTRAIAEEHAVLQKSPPLGYADSARWHWSHFRRLRPFDAQWRGVNPYAGFLEYLTVFLKVPDTRAVPRALLQAIRSR